MPRHLAGLAMFLATAASAEVPLPQGWRQPAAAENQACVRPGDDPYRVTADFDGDGQLDEARLLIKRRGHTLGLWVFLANRDPVLLFHWDEVSDGQHSLGIAVVPGPGSSVTWCGQAGSCEPGEPSRVSWSRPGIDLYRCESSNQFIWWDSGGQRFRAAWMTD